VRLVNDVISDIIREKAGREPTEEPMPWSEGHGKPQRGSGVQHYLSEGKRCAGWLAGLLVGWLLAGWLPCCLAA
jgi:hypothetical protein